MNININKLSLYEVLEMIDKDLSLLGNPQYFPYAKHSPLTQVFECAFLPERKFKLPEGTPNYKESTEPVGATPTDLLIAIRSGRFAYFLDEKQVNKQTKERIFIQLLESVHPSEAKVLIAIKEQKLTDLFPNITHRSLAEHGYLPMPPETPKSDEMAEAKDVVEKPKQKRNRKPKMDVVTEG